MTHKHKTGPFTFGQLQSMALNAICLTKMAKEEVHHQQHLQLGLCLCLSPHFTVHFLFFFFHTPFFSTGFSCSPWTSVISSNSSSSCHWPSVQGSDAMNGLFYVFFFFPKLKCFSHFNFQLFSYFYSGQFSLFTTVHMFVVYMFSSCN